MMCKGFLVLSLLAVGTLCLGQVPLNQVAELPKSLQEFVGELASSRQADHKKLRSVFFEVKRHYLINHQLSSTYASTLRGETYDCVTGTLLFDNLLKALGFQTTIHEFNHHVLLAVKTGTEEILFDSTDPYGIIRGKREVAATLAYYKKQKRVLPHTNIYETIEADQALGLYYFNQSVKHLDIEEIDMAKAYADLAFRQYPCDRTLALADLLSRPPTQILSEYGKK